MLTIVLPAVGCSILIPQAGGKGFALMRVVWLGITSTRIQSVGRTRAGLLFVLCVRKNLSQRENTEDCGVSVVVVAQIKGGEDNSGTIRIILFASWSLVALYYARCFCLCIVRSHKRMV